MYDSSKKNRPVYIDRESLHHQLKSSFSTVKEEMEEHLDAINENTSEIQESSDKIIELECKIDKMEVRMEEMHMMVRQIINSTKVSIELNPDEQRIFLILYTHDSFLSAQELAERFVIPLETVTLCLLSMADKGVPIDKELLNGDNYYKLEPEFKAMQAKEKLIKIDVSITRQYQNKLLNKFFS